MAFPWDKEENFEDGTAGIFDGTEVDTDGRLNIRSYRQLAANGTRRAAPFRGAYCAEVDLGVGANNAFLLDPDGNIAADGETFFDFYFYVSPTIAGKMVNDDQFSIFQLIATSTVEGVIDIQFTTANGLRIGVGETAATAFASLTTGVWHHACLGVVIDDGASDDGTLTLWLDDASVATVGSLDQGAITDIRLGVVGQDRVYDDQFILFDNFREDSARLRPVSDRFPQSAVLTKSGHAFIGPGVIQSVNLLASATADCIVRVYDTDRADTSDPDSVVAQVSNTVAANSEIVRWDSPIRVDRGAYVTIAGTASANGPKALLKLDRVAAYGSDGAILRYGSRVA